LKQIEGTPGEQRRQRAGQEEDGEGVIVDTLNKRIVIDGSLDLGVSEALLTSLCKRSDNGSGRESTGFLIPTPLVRIQSGSSVTPP
jgi:hypothetical protein